MRITLESTTKVITVNGVPARVWEGHSEGGARVEAWITRIRVPLQDDQAEFERELDECRPPSADVAALPPHIVL